MKKIATIMGLFGLIFVQAQVGINNENPDATLDVAAGKTDGSQVEGLLVPRISKKAASTMAGNPKLKESTLVYVDNTADYTITPVATSVEDITEKGYYFWNGDNKWVKTAGKDGAEWVYNSTTKQVDLKRSGLTPSINKIFYDEKGRYRSLAEDEAFTTYVSVSPNFNITTLTRNLNDNDGIGEATIFESINSKNNPIYTNVRGRQSKRHLVRNYLVNKSDAVKKHYFSRDVMTVPMNNANNYSHVYNAIDGNDLNGKGNIAVSISDWGFLRLGGSQKITGYATSLMGESTYFGSGSVRNFYGIVAQNRFQSGTGTIDRSIAGYFTSNSMPGSNDATLIRHNYGIKNYLASTSNNTAAGIELAGMTTTTTHSGQTKYPNMYGIKSATTIGTGTDVINPTNLYGLWLGDAKGAEQNNYAIYTNAGRVSFGDVIQLRATRTPSSSTDVLATDKEGDVIRDADFIYVLVNEAGTLKWKRLALSAW